MSTDNKGFRTSKEFLLNSIRANMHVFAARALSEINFNFRHVASPGFVKSEYMPLPTKKGKPVRISEDVLREVMKHRADIDAHNAQALAEYETSAKTIVVFEATPSTPNSGFTGKATLTIPVIDLASAFSGEDGIVVVKPTAVTGTVKQLEDEFWAELIRKYPLIAEELQCVTPLRFSISPVRSVNQPVTLIPAGSFNLFYRNSLEVLVRVEG
jgi:hypothetical protein